ncbi:transposase family protein [Halanaerobium sp. MA284_MarDTE_T2]|jgi:transposase|uniref:transposase family protein n=1 Tax=Halanaerobium sp. MA284_MarDTE_T2 TaxID=2183913 RepID=UPI000DF4BC7C|nr:transposase family protein [Halanaerobium sp. MA284_MarDTE_T2]RCW44765.1 transposase IS204/IS1001/IS1096/IS1165 family protein [Halanaerobium sp. MA284_MarDTE_T2]
MHTNLITDLPDLVATELIQTEEYLTFIVDYKTDHVKCPSCGRKVGNIHDRRPKSIQDVPFRDKKVVIKIVKKRYNCKHYDKRAIPKNLKSIPGYSRKT